MRKIYNDYKLPIINEKGTIYYNSKGYGKGDKRSKIYSITEGWRRPSKTTKMEIVNLFIHNLLVAEYQAKNYDLNPEAIKLAITTPEGTNQTTLEQLINIKEKLLDVLEDNSNNPNWFDDAWKRKLTPEEKLLLVGVVGLTEDVRGKPQSQWLNVVKNPVAYLEGKPVVDLPKQELANVLDKLNLGELDINLEYIGKASSDIITEELNLKIRGETGRPDRIEVPILNFKNSFTQLVREVDEAIRITSDPAERVKLETLKRKLEGTVELLDGMITRWKGGSRRNLKAMAVAGVAMSALKQGYLLYKFGQALFIAGAKTALELILASPRIAAYIASTPWLQTLLGGILSTVFFILSNIDLSYFKSMKTNGLSALTRIVSVETTEALEKLDKAGMILSFYLGGFSTILKSIGVQFYFPEEIVYVIGDALNKVAEGVGDVWNTIMGFKIPLLDQTVFEILASYLLSGPLNTILGIIIGLLVQKLLAPLLDKIIIQGLIILAFNT